MKSTEFKVWMRSIERMSRTQRDKLRKRLKGKEDADEVVVLIECSSVSGKILRQHFFLASLGKIRQFQQLNIT